MKLTAQKMPHCAGRGPYTLSPPCWTCSGDCDWSYLRGEYAVLQTPGTPPGYTSISAKISVPGGGPYRLAYILSLTSSLRSSPDPPNSWQATIESMDGSFAIMVLESIINYPDQFDKTQRVLAFNLPSNINVVKLTFDATQVSKMTNLHLNSYEPLTSARAL